MFHKLHVLGMNGDLWDRVRGLYTTICIDDTKEPIHCVRHVLCLILIYAETDLFGCFNE